MMIIDPVTLGDVSCTRASTKTAYDRNGAAFTVPANTLAVTYNPADLTQAPYALIDSTDVIGSGAGLVYSNVAITETPYSSTAYANGAVVYDQATYLTYQSIADANTGNALSNTAKWTPLLVPVNRKQMFDQYNYTQTQNAEEIIVVLSPQAVSRGVYLGNVDASEVRISVTDPVAGLVYQEVQNLIVSNSGSSAYAWCFNPIDKSDYAVSVLLPPYANALVTIAIKAPGATAKCGVCAIGPVVDVGLSQYGLSWELQDYSTINFNMDGTSNVVPRNYAKKLSADVIIDNTRIAAVTRNLSRLHQKPVAWVGASMYGPACAYGRYESFKGVINYPTQSQMTLSILGTV